MIKLTEAQLFDMLKSAWWAGHEESRYSPNPSGAANRTARELIKDHLDEQTNA